PRRLHAPGFLRTRPGAVALRHLPREPAHDDAVPTGQRRERGRALGRCGGGRILATHARVPFLLAVGARRPETGISVRNGHFCVRSIVEPVSPVCACRPTSAGATPGG